MMFISCCDNNLTVCVSKPRWSTTSRPVFMLTFLCLIISTFIFYATNFIVDWDDPRNWSYTRRYLPADQMGEQHFESSRFLSCYAMLSNDAEEITRYKRSGRYVLHDQYDVSMSCKDIRYRIVPTRSQPKLKNTYAVSRVVYSDYHWLESVLSHTYSPDNFYCYAVDSKASDKFYQSIKHWETCFDNVIVIDKRYPYDSSGHYINFGHYECTKELIKRKGWKYILWLQNYDLVLRTNEEMSTIMDFMNGSHSIGHKPAQWKRYNVLKKWSTSSLQLWKNESEVSHRQKNALLHMSQNYNEVFLSRQLINFVLEKMNFENLLDALEQPFRFATDEMLWATLIASTDLELPGQPKDGCHSNDYYITRFNQWQKWYDTNECKSEYSRHGTCLFGVEYLPTFSNLHQIVANKVMPTFDYGMVMCYGALLYNRTFLNQEGSNLTIYKGDSSNFC